MKICMSVVRQILLVWHAGFDGGIHFQVWIVEVAGLGLGAMPGQARSNSDEFIFFKFKIFSQKIPVLSSLVSVF